METFQKLVLYSAIFMLLAAFIFVAYSLRHSNGKFDWPPAIADCPDYWSLDVTGTKCVNIQDLGVCPAQSGEKHLTMDFNTPVFSGNNKACAKYTWATKCGVAWDGITYGVKNPCNT